MNTSEKWLEIGYNLFAKEGPEGIQIERLARILGLNKSGFYHYFGDLESYFKQILRWHYRAYSLFIEDVSKCQNVDPEYLLVGLQHKAAVMVQMQLVRHKETVPFCGAHKELDDKLGHVVLSIWADHIDIHNNPDLVIQYHAIIRDMFYSRISWENFTLDNIRIISNEAKDIVAQVQKEIESLVPRT